MTGRQELRGPKLELGKTGGLRLREPGPEPEEGN